MIKNSQIIPCSYMPGEKNGGGIGNDEPQQYSSTPLTSTCGCEKVKICKINGDRKMCARMAQLGFLPGSELELVCPGQSKQCMVRIKGSTVTLDELQAQNIYVTPV